MQKQNMKTKNFGEFRDKELTGTNGLLNEFMRAFDLHLLQYMSYEDNKIGRQAREVRDYYEIDEAGQKLLLGLKEELTAFRTDYYEQKSTFEIA